MYLAAEIKSRTPAEIINSPEFDEYQATPANQYTKINAQQLAKNPILLDCLRAPDGFKFVQLDFCYTADTEILTESGWKTFDQVNTKTKVWQVNPDTLRGSWVHPSRVIWRDYDGPVYTYGNRRGKLSVTYGHTMLWAGQQTHTRKDKASLRKVIAAEMGIPINSTTLLTSTRSDQESVFSTQDIWLSCMLAADGHRTPYGKYQIEVSKPRKRSKVAELLGRPGIIRPPRQNQTCESESWYGIEYKCDLLCPDTKRLRLDNLGANQVEDFVQALAFWDGHTGGNKTGRFYWTTTDEQQADHVQQYLVRCGYEAKKTLARKPMANQSAAWTLSCRKAAGLRLRKNIDESISDYTGKVGCVTVPEGFILVRQNGQTFVSGNCALEPHVLAHFSGCPTYHKLYCSGEPHDVYLFVACKLLDPELKLTRVYQPDSPTEESVKLAKETFKSDRTAAKPFVLMSTYKAGAPKIHRKTTLMGFDFTRDQVKQMRAKYWGPELFGEVLVFEESLVAEVAQRDGWMMNGLGRPFVVTSRKEKDVVNTHTQSTGHDITDLLVLFTERLHRERNIPAIPIIEDYHDETIWMCRDTDAPAFAQVLSDAVTRVNDALKFSVTFKGDPEITANFTEFKKPDGTKWYTEKCNATPN